MNKSPIIVALDFSSEKEVLDFIEPLTPDQCRLKVGKELFTACGPSLVKRIVASGFDVFLDLKFHDIPNTVAGALRSACDLGVWMVNVHASGGPRMLEAARKALSMPSDPILIAVTVLTSLDVSDLLKIGINDSLEKHIFRLARLASDAGLDGVVCSAQEVSELRKSMGSQFCLVTPGIRPLGSDVGDQRRVVAPDEAIRLGSDYLVIGRPITQARRPEEVLRQINASLI